MPEPVSKRPDAEETLRLILARLDDMKAEDTVTIDLTGKTSIADAMVVTSGRSNRHVTSIADSAIEGLNKAGVKGIRVEGKTQRRLGADRCRRRHRPCVPAGSARLLRSRKDVGGRRRRRQKAGASTIMRLVVAAIGRLKEARSASWPSAIASAPSRPAAASAFATSEVVEIRESRAQEVGKRMIEESIALANVIPDKAVVIILDERGESLDSATLASRLGRWRDDGRPAAVFIIGGDDGLAPSLRDKASVRLAFGAATWPHQLVRVMLLEQIYRAVSILSGHPYHRA